MGYLTTITIHNDALHAFEKNPEQFGKAILEGISRARMERKAVDVGFDGYCNYITVEPSRHADDHTVFVHTGNTVFNVNPYNEDFRELLARSPEVAAQFVGVADGVVAMAKEKLKVEAKKKKKALSHREEFGSGS
jgi:hypothetical protein